MDKIKMFVVNRQRGNTTVNQSSFLIEKSDFIKLLQRLNASNKEFVHLAEQELKSFNLPIPDDAHEDVGYFYEDLLSQLRGEDDVNGVGVVVDDLSYGLGFTLVQAGQRLSDSEPNLDFEEDE